MLSFLALKIALVAFLISVCSVPIVRLVALRLGLVDIPNHRKVHVEHTPLLGGLAVWLGFAGGLAMAGHFGLVGYSESTTISLQGIVLGSVAIFSLGVLDDKIGIAPKWKLIGQVLVATLLVVTEHRVSVFIQNNFVTTLITMIWIVGIINSFNLLDNMNGLTTGVALIASVAFAMIAFDQNNIFVIGVCAALAGALAGFLPHNFPKARIFMGDGGSMLVGFVLAAISVKGIYVSATKLTHLPVIAPILVLGVPLFDTFSVIVIRIVRGLPIFEADKNHFSHRLLDLGMTMKQAVLLIFLVEIAVCIPATLLSHVTINEAVMLLMQEVILFVIIVSLMRAGMVAAEKHRAPDDGVAGEK